MFSVAWANSGNGLVKGGSSANLGGIFSVAASMTGFSAVALQELDTNVAVGAVLDRGLRTADIAVDAATAVGTQAMGDAVLNELAQGGNV